MKKITISIATLLTLNAFGVEMNRSHLEEQRTPPLREYVPQPIPNVSTNIPFSVPSNGYQNYLNPNYYNWNDNTLVDEYSNEDIFQLKLNRCVVQYINVMMQITTGILFISSQCCMDKYVEAAKILNAIGLSLGLSSFILNIFLIRMDNKIEDIDNYRLRNNIYPDVVPR